MRKQTVEQPAGGMRSNDSKGRLQERVRGKKYLLQEVFYFSARGIFDDDDSDVGSETSYYSDESVESFGEPEPGSSSWLRVSKTSTSFKGKNVAHIDISDDEEELELGSPGPTTTVAPVQFQPFSEYAYAPQTAIGPSHFQGSPIPRYPNQTTPGPSQYNQAAFSPHLYNQSTPASYHYNQATPSPHYYNQATSGHHNHCTPQGSHFVNTAAPYYPVNQHSSSWSSTPSTSQAASSSTTSASSFEVESNMTQEVYDAVGRYLEKESDPKRIAAKKLLQEEDKTCCPEWRQLYSSIPLGKLPSVEDCNILAPPKLKVLALVPIPHRQEQGAGTS
ncbi:hypothetical protein F5H01DRAFT_398392 [Linnemannia elongata]|nr:hypothetical protein F5H01DRAFT_398392 [Linnemannia elongata]